MTHEHPFSGNCLRKADFLSTSSDQGIQFPAKVSDLEKANLVTSEIEGTGWPNGDPWHRPVLDIDFPAKLIPSTTEGHYHLYLDAEMSWSNYEKLLRVLSEVGIIQGGYAAASIERGYTAVRLPWVKKESL